MFLALLAIFDTQVLSIFKRRKEIGTLVALGMTRWQVVRLFTVEGALHGVLAACLAALYGIPIFVLTARLGIAMPEMSRQALPFGIAQRIFPTYGIGLVAGTVLLILVSVTIVSFLPSRKIAKMKPTDALKGRSK